MTLPSGYPDLCLYGGTHLLFGGSPLLMKLAGPC